jgi:acetylornithine/succinyldiaminopimelate/putrescine aminotransferase
MCLKNGDVAAVIIEGIQGIGGINIPEKKLFNWPCRNLQKNTGAF